MGHTVWYTVVGTGDPITIDTSASDFDTVAAAYVADGGGLTEVACIDDQEFVPIGASYQAILTFDTDAGVEYFDPGRRILELLQRRCRIGTSEARRALT